MVLKLKLSIIMPYFVTVCAPTGSGISSRANSITALSYAHNVGLVVCVAWELMCAIYSTVFLDDLLVAYTKFVL